MRMRRLTLVSSLPLPHTPHPASPREVEGDTCHYMYARATPKEEQTEEPTVSC
jgi:hypothetical protein